MADEVSSQASPLPAMRHRLTAPAPTTTRERSPIPTPRSTQNRVVASPDVRRRTESPRINRSVTNSVPPRVEFSPTAKLIHKLFRNRDPRLLPDPSEVSPLAPSTSRASPRLPIRQISNEAFYSEIASVPSECNDGGSSEYLSIDNLSLILSLEDMRADTPPPPYRTIFDDEK